MSLFDPRKLRNSQVLALEDQYEELHGGPPFLGIMPGPVEQQIAKLKDALASGKKLEWPEETPGMRI